MHAHLHYQPHATSPVWQPGLTYTAVGNSKRGLILYLCLTGTYVENIPAALTFCV